MGQDRQNWITWWNEIAYRVMPSAATFEVDVNEGEKRTERQFSGKPVIANERFAAVMDDLLTPRNQEWHGLEPEDPELAEQHDVKVYLERLTKLLFAKRYRPAANFAGQKSQGYLSLGAFGNSCMFIGDDVGVGPAYMNIPLREVKWAQNHRGMIDTVHRRFKLQARQAVQQFGLNKLPEKIRKAYADQPFTKFEFLHCVCPNEELNSTRRDYRGMPWSSCYVSVDEEAMIDRGGFPQWPFAIGRYMLAADETYARSPAMSAWGAILTLNEEKKTIMRAGQREVEPPLLMSDDGALDGFNLRNGALNPGTMSEGGVALVQALKTNGNVPLGLELMQIEGQEIDDAFLVSIYQFLVEENINTATQVMEVLRQKGAILAPVMGRQYTEDLGPLIDREIQILAANTENAWISQEMPDALREAGGVVKCKLTSPMAKAMEAGEAVGLMRTFEALGSAIQVDPKAAFVLDVPGGLRRIAEVNGVPAKFIRDEKMAQQLSDDHDAQSQLAQAAAVAPNLSQAALNAAKADSLRTGA